MHFSQLLASGSQGKANSTKCRGFKWTDQSCSKFACAHPSLENLSGENLVRSEVSQTPLGESLSSKQNVSDEPELDLRDKP